MQPPKLVSLDKVLGPVKQHDYHEGLQGELMVASVQARYETRGRARKWMDVGHRGGHALSSKTWILECANYAAWPSDRQGKVGSAQVELRQYALLVSYDGLLVSENLLLIAHHFGQAFLVANNLALIADQCRAANINAPDK